MAGFLIDILHKQIEKLVRATLIYVFIHLNPTNIM